MRRNKKTIIIVAICAIVVFIIGYATFGSESFKRSFKNLLSNYSGGIRRTVRVYDIEGDLIEEYKGKFDIDSTESDKIIFDDENGKRHIIYYKTGTIIVDEE